jgi:hypothetical protein
MTFSKSLSQYEEILKDAIQTSANESSAKLAKLFRIFSLKYRHIIHDFTQKDKFHADVTL